MQTVEEAEGSLVACIHATVRPVLNALYEQHNRNSSMTYLALTRHLNVTPAAKGEKKTIFSDSWLSSLTRGKVGKPNIHLLRLLAKALLGHGSLEAAAGLGAGCDSVEAARAAAKKPPVVEEPVEAPAVEPSNESSEPPAAFIAHAQIFQSIEVLRGTIEALRVEIAGLKKTP